MCQLNDTINTIEHFILHGDETFVVLIHDGIGCCSLWKSFPQLINDYTGHSVFVYSRYNHGKSALNKDSFSFKNEIYILHELLTHYNIKNPILFGHSIGAVIAMFYANTHKINKLVLTSPYVIYDESIISGMNSIKHRYESRKMTELISSHIDADLMFYNWYKIPRKNDERITDNISEISCELVCIKYIDDPYFGNKQCELLQQYVPNSTVILLPGTTHTIHKRTPEVILPHLI